MDKEEMITIIIFLSIITVLLTIVVVCSLKEEKQIKNCFMMENKTKECEYLLWNKEHTRNSTSVVPMPVIINR